MSFFLQAVGIREAKAFFSEIERELKEGLRDRLKRAAKIVEDEAKSQTDSKRVRSAITSTVTVESLIDYRASIGPLRKRAFFAHFLEFGTRPHLIRNAWGHPGASVAHPGARARPFLAPAIQVTEERVVDLVGVPPSLR